MVGPPNFCADTNSGPQVPWDKKPKRKPRMTNKTTSANDLLALAERCEAATGPDRELDLAITPNQRARLHFTASVDAALTLVPEGMHFTNSGEGRFLTSARYVATVESWATEDDAHGGVIYTTPTRRSGVGHTFALAICAAALRARAAA